MCCGCQSRYVGYYEVMKTKFNRQLPPAKSLRIKSFRIHSIAGKPTYPQHRRELHNISLTCFFFFVCSYPGVGKGDGSDLKVKIIVKKELVFQCVCAKQENCSVRLHTLIGS